MPSPMFCSRISLNNSQPTFNSSFCSSVRYHTGTFYLGYFNGPTEGLKMLLASYLWTWYAGMYKYKWCTIAELHCIVFVATAQCWPCRQALHSGFRGGRLHSPWPIIGARCCPSVRFVLSVSTSSLWRLCSSLSITSTSPLLQSLLLLLFTKESPHTYSIVFLVLCFKGTNAPPFLLLNSIKSVVDYKRKEGQPLGPAVQHLLSFAFYFAMALTW